MERRSSRSRQASRSQEGRLGAGLGLGVAARCLVALRCKQFTLLAMIGVAARCLLALRFMRPILPSLARLGLDNMRKLLICCGYTDLNRLVCLADWPVEAAWSAQSRQCLAGFVLGGGGQGISSCPAPASFGNKGFLFVCRGWKGLGLRPTKLKVPSSFPSP